MKPFSDSAHWQLAGIHLGKMIFAMHDARASVHFGGGLRQRELQGGVQIVTNRQQRPHAHHAHVLRGKIVLRRHHALMQGEP